MVWSSITFRKRMLIIMTLSGLIELLLLVAAGFMYVKHSQEQEVGQKALGVAAFLAQTPAVINMIKTGSATGDQQQSYRELTQLIGAAFIVIGDNQLSQFTVALLLVTRSTACLEMREALHEQSA